MVFNPRLTCGCQYDAIPRIRNAIYLYDGPPSGEPPNEKMVCFTCPNYSWLDSICKSALHTPMYLPPWILDELYEARNCLKLDIDYKVIEERFRFFGGSARFCLSLDESYVSEARDTIQVRLNKIKSLDDIAVCLNKRSDLRADGIFHYIPRLCTTVPFARFYWLEFASSNIANIVERNMVDESESRRAEFVRDMNGIAKAASVIDWLFEVYCKNRFLNKVEKFTIQPLCANRQGFEFSLSPGTFVHLDKDRCESFDDKYYDERTNTLYLFQIDRNNHNGIKGRDIKKQLCIHFGETLESGNQTRHIDDILKLLVDTISQLDIRIIFIVPKGMNDFKRQEIEFEDFSKGTLSDVCNGAGIGRGKSLQLFKKRIHNVGQLKAMIETDASLNISLVKEFEANIERSEKLNEIIKGIPQYLLVLEGEYK